MLRPISTAVIATVDRFALQSVAFLLAESQISLIGVARNGMEAIDRLKSLRPELLIADAALPMLSGYKLIERSIGTFCLPVRPSAILLDACAAYTPNALQLRALGAVILGKPPDQRAFSDAIAHLRQAKPIFPESEIRIVEKLLEAIGMPDHIGRKLIRSAVLISAHDEAAIGKLMSYLIPRSAEMCAVSTAQAEHAMRHAISLAWQSDKFENQYRIFSDTVDAGRGQPTLSEMISRLADILRLEG